jgi:hypothetical protein
MTSILERITLIFGNSSFISHSNAFIWQRWIFAAGVQAPDIQFSWWDMVWKTPDLDRV